MNERVLAYRVHILGSYSRWWRSFSPNMQTCAVTMPLQCSSTRSGRKARLLGAIKVFAVVVNLRPLCAPSANEARERQASEASNSKSSSRWVSEDEDRRLPDSCRDRISSTCPVVPRFPPPQALRRAANSPGRSYSCVAHSTVTRACVFPLTQSAPPRRLRLDCGVRRVLGRCGCVHARAWRA